MNGHTKFQAERVSRLNPYVPGEQPRDRDYIKLNANENPYPPSPAVLQAVLQTLRDNPMATARYPDPDSLDLKKAIASLLNRTGGVLARAVVAGGAVSPSPGDALGFEVTPEMIFCGNGSDEVLSFVFYAFFDGDRPLITLEHTYSFYPVYGLYYGIPLKAVPLTPRWQVDVSGVAEAAGAADSGVILPNPNAPTGIALSREEVRGLLRRCPPDRAVVIDEAYADFGGESCLGLLPEFPNLVIVRTFSKSLSGAGLRLGYAVASGELCRVLTQVKNSFNHFPLDALTQRAGIAACSDPAWYAANAAKIASERDSLAAFLRDRGWLVLPSSANFLFTQKPGHSGRALYGRLRDQGILVRRFDIPGIEDFLRITVGTAAQMAALKEALG